MLFGSVVQNSVYPRCFVRNIDIILCIKDTICCLSANDKLYMEFESKGGFTNMDLFRCVYEGYKKIYDEEEAEVDDPGIYDRLYNRRPSHGKYGIWEHYMNDLFLEIIYYNPEEKLCTLAIGS